MFHLMKDVMNLNQTISMITKFRNDSLLNIPGVMINPDNDTISDFYRKKRCQKLQKPWIFISEQIHKYSTPPLWKDLVKISRIKLWHTSSFLLKRTDFENVIFEKNPWALLRTPRLPRSNNLETQNDKNYKWKLIKNRWNPKFGLRDLKNGLLTSRTSERALIFFQKAPRKMSYSSAFWSKFENYQFLTLCPRGHQESVKNW